MSEWNLLGQSSEGDTEDNPGPEDWKTVGGGRLPLRTLPPSVSLKLPGEGEVGPDGEAVQEEGGLFHLCSQHQHHLQLERSARQLEGCRENIHNFNLNQFQPFPWLSREEENDCDSVRGWPRLGLKEEK